MLFPGHERSQRLLCGSVHSGDGSESQERANNEKDKHAKSPVNFDLPESFEHVQQHAPSSVQKQKQSPTSVSTQTRVKFDDRWPNGTPPTGPRKSLKWAGQYHSRRQSGAGEIGQCSAANGTSSSRWIRPRPPLSLVHHTGMQSPAIAEPVDEATTDVVTAFESLHGRDPYIQDYGQKIGEIAVETGVNVSKRTTTPELMDQLDGACNIRLQKNDNLTEYSPPDVGTLLSPANVLRVPRSSSPQLPSFAKEPRPHRSSGSSTISSKYAAAKKNTMDVVSPSGVRHRDIAYFKNRTRKPGSETASITSASSSAAGMSSSSSVSSILQLSKCHICKKPPFKEELKGCVECSRRFHKGCAKPKDRCILSKELYLP
jgi:hypothetical protein